MANRESHSNSFQRIIVRMPNWIGDCVMATPLLCDLRSRYPMATITAMCQAKIAPLLLHDPHLNDRIAFNQPSGWLHRKEQLQIIEPLRHEQFDLGLLMTNSFSSAWWFWRAQVKRRIGFATHWRSWLLTDRLPWPKEACHQIDQYHQLLSPLGAPSTSATLPRLYLHEQEIKEARTLLQQCGWPLKRPPLLGINPGAAYGSAKCWLPDRFEALTEKLLKESSFFIVYFGDSAGKPLVDSICQRFPERVINLAGKSSLRELMALISLCDLFLSNDSGPMHMAAALGVPLVALFGSTSALKTGPRGTAPVKVIHKQVACSPCYKRVCPIDFRCMKQIEVNEVYDALMELSAQSPAISPLLDG